jgi:hypothetical protein
MEAFGILVIVVTVASAVISVVFYLRADSLYKQIGRLGELWLDASENPNGPTREASREDLRQMVEAISRRPGPRAARPGAERGRPGPHHR